MHVITVTHKNNFLYKLHYNLLKRVQGFHTSNDQDSNPLGLFYIYQGHATHIVYAGYNNNITILRQGRETLVSTPYAVSTVSTT